MLLAAALVAVAAASALAGDGDGDGFLHRLMTEARQRLDAAATGRAPKLVPPQPVAMRRVLKKVGSLELGAPLVALTAADLDGDRKAELYAVTSREVIAIAIDRRPRELARVAFAAEPAAMSPRDMVGTAVADGNAIVASVSSRAKSLRVHWKGRALVGEAGDPGFLLCPGERAELAGGRDYFTVGGAQLYGVRCRNDLVDAQGYPLHVRAALSIGNRLDIEVARCPPGGACEPATRFGHGEVGVAFELADLDRDGVPELIFAGDGAPGDPDTLRIASLGDDPKHPKLKRPFTAGGIAGIAAADVDGDGLVDVIVATRLVGATRVDLWRLE